MYDRSFAIAGTNAALYYIPIFAVKEQNGGNPVHMLVRLLYTGTPVPCALYYETPDCTGTVLGVHPGAATGFACAIPGGHAGRADPTAAPTVVTPGSFSTGRYDGAELSSTCIVSSAPLSVLPLQDLGLSATVSSRVYLEPAQ